LLLSVAAGSAAARQRGAGDGEPVVERIRADESSLDATLPRDRGPRSGRTACHQPFPNFDPPTPGTCFFNTDAGAFFNLTDDEGEFLFVITPGDSNDVLRYGPEPDRPLYTHQTSIDAEFAYCPPGVVGVDCVFIIFPGALSWQGTGRITVDGALDRGLNFSCPITVTGRGTVSDPDSGDPHDVRVRIVRTKDPDGGCRDVSNEITVTPLRENPD
jgi:hypothetical protein